MNVQFFAAGIFTNPVALSLRDTKSANQTQTSIEGTTSGSSADLSSSDQFCSSDDANSDHFISDRPVTPSGSVHYHVSLHTYRNQLALEKDDLVASVIYIVSGELILRTTEFR